MQILTVESSVAMECVQWSSVYLFKDIQTEGHENRKQNRKQYKIYSYIFIKKKENWFAGICKKNTAFSFSFCSC